MLDRESILEEIKGYGKPRSEWRIGGEFERILVNGDGSQASYHQPHGIEEVLEGLVAGHGWQPVREGERLIGLTRDGASTTLEPGGQVELSGQPHLTLSALASEAHASLQELHAVTADTDCLWVALGLTPYSPIDSISWVPKGRYEVMKRYLPRQGEMAPIMMKATSSFQANFDYEDEEDCRRKFIVLQHLAPLHTALFANSPLLEGRATGWLSNRGRAWRHTDPARTGFPTSLRNGYSHEAWLDYLLDVPMMFVRQGDRWLSSGDTTFRRFMDRGVNGQFPTMEDFRLHQTAVFPEVRVKSTIEIRGADACPLPIALGGIALWTGFLYDPQALYEAGELGREFAKLAPVEVLFDGACREGLKAEFGHPLWKWCSELLEVAEAGLRRTHPGELGLLEPIRIILESRQSPAERVLEAWGRDPSPGAFLREVSYNFPS